MTPAKLRPAVLIAVLTALVAGLTACGSGPSQVNAAVIVDGKSISVNDVQNLLDKIVREQPAAKPLAQQRKLDMVAREAVSQLVMHDVLVKAAREENITVGREDVADAMAQNPFREELPNDGSVPPDALATQLVYRARDLRDTITDQILLAQLANKYFDKLQVTMDYTTVVSDDPGANPESMRDKAVAKAREFAADPDNVAQLIAEDTQAGGDAQEGAQFPAVQSAALAATAMFGSSEGSVVAFEPSPEQALWVVGLIRERDTNANVDTSQAPQVQPTELVAVGERLLQPYAEDSEIRVSPRYGVWDMAAMAVAPSEAETVGLILPPATDESQ
ncbi:SurA N-terminal domain-containing protein [Actinophytocola sp.]|uniref:SurA N-terminal domain-containing protein n=1 Tax=Actinophytocola sp. TaxID=1872138 RepID=UPI003D6A08B9